MAYKIRFDGCGSTTVCAQSRSQALSLAEVLTERGRRNITISLPDGSVLAPAPPATGGPDRA